MTPDLFQALAGWLIAPLLVVVIAFDLKYARIPNLLVAAVFGVFVLTIPLSIPFDALIWRIVAAAVVFAICFAAFAIRLLGGGDVKLMTVLVLFVPTGDLALVVLLFSVCAIVTLTAIRLARVVSGNAQLRWAALRDHSRFPLGPAIASAGLIYLFWGTTLAGLF